MTTWRQGLQLADPDSNFEIGMETHRSGQRLKDQLLRCKLKIGGYNMAIGTVTLKSELQIRNCDFDLKMVEIAIHKLWERDSKTT